MKKILFEPKSINSDDHSLKKSITWRYLIAISLIALLSSGTLFTFLIEVDNEEARANVVNLSGRQRMLSQVILRNVEIGQKHKDELFNNKSIELFEKSIGDFISAHAQLKTGQLSNGQNYVVSPEIEAILYSPPYNLNQKFEIFVHQVSAAMKAIKTGKPISPEVVAYLEGPKTFELLAALEAFVLQVQKDGEKSIAFIKKLEWGIFFTTITVLLLEIIFIFSPLARYVDHLFMEVVAARRTAEAGNRAKSVFLANMSHEFRTPLNAIIGFSDALRNRIFGQLANDQQKEYIESIHSSGQHLQKLVDDILDLSSLDAGNLPLHPEQFDLKKECEAISRMVHRDAVIKGIKLTHSFEHDNFKVYTDKKRCAQILINLLNNAIKFTESGGDISLNVSSKTGDQDRIVIKVKDTGIGIKKNDIPNITKPYSRESSLTAHPQAGAGLGLPITNSLVHALGGTLEISSNLNAGTEVTVEIPQTAA